MVPSIPQFADSLADPDNTQLMQRWWTGVTPMEAQLYPDGSFQPGLAPASEALPALKLRETSCYSGAYGLYVEGGPGCDPGTYTGHTQQACTLNTGVMAVGLGNYGLLGNQQRYTDDLATLQLGPAAAGSQASTAAEQPGAMPEIGPSPDFKANIDQPFEVGAEILGHGEYRLGDPAHDGRPDVPADRDAGHAEPEDGLFGHAGGVPAVFPAEPGGTGELAPRAGAAPGPWSLPRWPAAGPGPARPGSRRACLPPPQSC